MEVDVFNMEGQKVSTVDLPSVIFEAPINVDLMHQAYVRQMANARLGTHSTKRRGEVAGGGRKPWKQKGTGRARQGSMISAQFVGGGRIHTPKPRDYTQAMPQKMRQAALRSALTVKASQKAVVMLGDVSMEAPKTAEMAKAVKTLAGEGRVLFLVPDKSEKFAGVVKSARNLANTQLLMANYLNIRDLFRSEKVIIPLASLEVIKSYLG